MAVVTATVLGGFWDAVAGGYTSIDINSRNNRQAARLINKNRTRRALLLALDGVVVGSNATDTSKRITATEELGGTKAIETQTNVNRNTVAGDVTDLNARTLVYGGIVASPVANLDGNPLGTR